VGLVPIVEPDVSMAGAHTLESALAINTKIQSVLYRALLEHGVFMEGVILKSNIVNPGKQCPVPYRCGSNAASAPVVCMMCDDRDAVRVCWLAQLESVQL
jgi:fructose-bisphosphate aldolase class I